jgi:hypothetical protein
LPVEKRTGKDGKQYKALQAEETAVESPAAAAPASPKRNTVRVLGKKQLRHMTQLKSAGMRFLEVYDARQLARDASHCILT